jgi:hypothetical protein
MSLKKIAINFVGYFVCSGAFAQQGYDCGTQLHSVLGKLSRVLMVKEPDYQRYRTEVKRELAGIPESCRTGLFYVAIARYLSVFPHQELTLQTTAYRTPMDALKMGLASDPSNPFLLAYVTHLSRYHPEKAPPLPEDACKRLSFASAEYRNEHLYVCAHVALKGGDFARAAQYLYEMDLSSEEVQRCYTDAPALLAEALAGIGERREAKKMLKVARKWLTARHLACWFGNFDDIEEIKGEMLKRTVTLLRPQ